MTREEAIIALESIRRFKEMCGGKDKNGIEALGLALTALRHQIWEEQLWHDAKADPPKAPGLYYGKNDDTNSMYACRYRDGVWTLDMHPQQQMDIIQWANYTAFAREAD